MQHQKWTVLKTEDVSPSKWFPIIKDTVRLPDGSEVEYFKSNLDNVAMIIAITKQKEVVFVKQYKHGVGEVVVELPAGRIDRNRSTEQTAGDEIFEETGIILSLDDLKPIAQLYTEPSKSGVKVFGFLATDVEVGEPQNIEKTEVIEVLKIPLPELKSFVMTEVKAADTLGLLMLAQWKSPEAFQ